MKPDDAISARLLVVDDDEAIRSLYQRAFTNAGYQVEVTANGQEALVALERQPVDLLLLDLCMPGMNGLSVLRTLRDRPNAPPAVVLSGCITSEEGAEAIRLGAAAVLLKCQPLAEVRARIAELLAPRRNDLFSLIRGHLHEPLTRKMVAHRLEVSEKTITNRIRRHCHQTFTEFLQTCRIEEAKSLLETTDLTIKEVAARVGFQSLRALDRVFQSYEGHSPTQYRRMIREGRVTG